MRSLAQDAALAENQGQEQVLGHHPDGGAAVAPADLLAFAIGAALVGDAQFVNAHAFDARQLEGPFGFKEYDPADYLVLI